MKTATTFDIVKITPANKAGNVVAEIRFHSNWKVYTYIRAIRDTKADGTMSIVISGQRVHFKWQDGPLGTKVGNVTEVTTEYEVAGKQKFKAGVKSEKPEHEIETKVVPEKPVAPVTVPDGPVHHEKYDTIKTCLEAGIPVYLAGPAGSGKNHTVEQIAKELGWSFHFSNSVQQEFKLTGFIDAGGKFHETEFYKACTSEGDSVFFLDEIDASIPEVLVLLNAAIANGYFEFPTGRVDLKHVHFVAAGNTVGAGADELYTGRMVIDQATLDRFAIVEFDYSFNIEMSITKGNTELVDFVRALRTEAKDKGIRAVFSYRALIQVTKLETAGMDLKEIIAIVIVKGLDKDTVATLNPSVYGNKYNSALKAIKAAA